MDRRFDREYWQLIWDKFRDGDRMAFENIYNEFADVLYAYGSKITHDKSLLEDSIHDLFIDVYSYGKSLRQPEYLEYYLFKTLKRILIRKLKESERFRNADEMSDGFELKFPAEETGEPEQYPEETVQILQKELKSLDAKKRELLFLKFSSGLSYAEIGRLLDINPDTAKKTVYRLISSLRGRIRKPLIPLFLFCLKK